MNDLPLNTQVGIINSRTAGNATIDDLINKVAHDDSLQVPNQPQGPIPEQLQQLQQGMNNGQT